MEGNGANQGSRRDDYIPPKRAYSLEAMLDDILDYAATSLKDHGRLAMWMPTANDQEEELSIPKHPSLLLVGTSVQSFNKCAYCHYLHSLLY